MQTRLTGKATVKYVGPHWDAVAADTEITCHKQVLNGRRTRRVIPRCNRACSSGSGKDGGNGGQREGGGTGSSQGEPMLDRHGSGSDAELAHKPCDLQCRRGAVGCGLWAASCGLWAVGSVASVAVGSVAAKEEDD